MHRDFPLRKQRPGRVDPEAIAIQGLHFIASDDDRLQRFMALTGITPDGIRDAASEPGFALSVLDFIGQDDETVLAFAAVNGLRPEDVMMAREKLAGPIWTGE